MSLKLSKLDKLSLSLLALADEIDGQVAALEKETDIKNVCTAWLRLKEQYGRLDDARKRVYHALDKMDKHVVPSALERAGLEKVQIPELARSFYISVKHSASMVDKDKGIKWLKKSGHADLVQETVNAGTLCAFLREYALETGKEPPEGLFTMNSYNTTGSSKYTPKKGDK